MQRKCKENAKDVKDAKRMQKRQKGGKRGKKYVKVNIICNKMFKKNMDLLI